MPIYEPGLFDNLLNLSASALDDLLVPVTETIGYRWISLCIGNGAYVGELTFEASLDYPDPGLWKPVMMYSMPTLSGLPAGGTHTSGTGMMLGTTAWFPFFRVRMSSYTNGVATGTLYMFRDGMPGFIPLTFGSILNPSTDYVGFVNNNGNQTQAIASGYAADTIVSPSPGMLASILVTAQNTHQMTIYDNDVAASGTVVGIVPANQSVDGKPLVLQMPVANGIYVAGDTNNPGVTISYIQI